MDGSAGQGGEDETVGKGLMGGESQIFRSRCRHDCEV